MKKFCVQSNIGRSKYVVSHHDGVTLNKDGSEFFGATIFKNKKKLQKFVADLKQRGYMEV